ncbi:hypothetical protein L1787_06020 [Acuticoccus sp. M5D2P5]|uniref:hypothetical protein n=1 Tax=Acuticoccus kalidii TaxID=2910977 RepID=UPI001F29AA19|nr:hypothetical protein [Acuticoccus kalidii]MCF3932970.1 hypothetical protein [Acuticoccus kalidii]
MPTADPLHLLLTSLVPLERDWRRLAEATNTDDEQAQIYYASALKDVQDRWWRILNAASCFPARTTEGALFQISAVWHLLDDLNCHGDMTVQQECVAQDARRAVDRLVASVRGYLNATAPESLQSMGLPDFISSSTDPWLDVDACLDLVQRGFNRKENQNAD